ncbi:MAG: hypothetical protein WD036_08430, partial [Bauldia sp.]
MLKILMTATALTALVAASPVVALEATPLAQPAPAAGQSETGSGQTATTAAVQLPKFIGSQAEEAILASLL